MLRRRRRHSGQRLASYWLYSSVLLLLDTFNRSNRVLDWAETGQLPIVNGTTTVANVIGNKMGLTVVGDGDGSVSWDTGTADVDFQVILGAAAAGADLKVFVRGGATNADMIYLALKQGTNQLIVHLVTAGVDTVLNTSTLVNGAFLAGADIEIMVREDHLMVLQGQEWTLKVSDPLILAKQGTRVGVFTSLTTTWDYVHVSLAPPVAIMDNY